MRTLQLIAILLIALVTVHGCRIASHAPNPQWLADFEKADAISIQKNNQQVALSDADTIDRLRDIYANAKWKLYWHTLPGHLNERTIDLLDGEDRLRHFSYTGSLWETESYTENRTADLSDSDRLWIESLFSALPEAEMSSEAEQAK